MLEIGTNLLTRTAEQTRKLNVVEAKVARGRRPADAGAGLRVLTVSRVPPGAEPHVSDRDPAPGELAVHQQAGEGAAAADDGDQPTARQEQVKHRRSQM